MKGDDMKVYAWTLIIGIFILGCSFGNRYKASKCDTQEDLAVKERQLTHDNQIEYLTAENEQKIETLRREAKLEQKRKEQEVALEHDAQLQQIFPTRWFTVGGLALFIAVATVGTITGNYIKAIAVATSIALPLISVGQMANRYPNAIIYSGAAVLALCVILCVWDFIMSRKNRLLTGDLQKVQGVADAISQAIEVTDAKEVKARIKENKRLAADVEAVCRKAIDEVGPAK